MKLSSEMLQSLPNIWNKKTRIVVFILNNFGFIAIVYVLAGGGAELGKQGMHLHTHVLRILYNKNWNFHYILQKKIFCYLVPHTHLKFASAHPE